MSGPRKRPVDPDRFPPCGVCGVRYADWRGEYPGGFKGPLAAHKASAFAMHCERCEDWPAAALAFDVARFDALDGRTCFQPLTDPRDDSTDDPFSGDVDPVAVCLEVAWAAREALARRILGADFQRVTEAA